MSRVFLILFLMSYSPFLWGQKQGICGRVVWEEGNRMPGPKTEKPPAKKIQRELYIYEPVSREQVTTRNGLYTEIRGKLVKSVNTNGDGTFKADLPPGEYSVFTREDDGFFANIYDDKGRINVVVVQPKKYTEMTFRVNYKAFY